MANGKVVITGGAGFIGSHTAVELCKAGYTPVVVDNFGNSDRRMLARVRELTGTSFPVYEIDCCDRSALRRAFLASLTGSRSLVGRSAWERKAKRETRQQTSRDRTRSC